MKHSTILLDTNILYELKEEITDFSEFKLKNVYDDLNTFLESNELNDYYTILIPEIVFEELKVQRLEKYKDNIDNLKKYYKRIERFDGSKLEIPTVNYKEKIQQLIEKYIQKNSIEILSIPRTKETFERIIERCINKKKPFCGEKGKSDKGFKDVVLWESLIEYAKKHGNDEEYILLTDNYTDFKEDILKKEFKDKTKLEISIFRDTAEMQEKILNNNNIKLYIYTKSDLNSNDLLIEKIKEYFEENEKNIEFNLDKIDDVVCTGKDYYEFSVYIRETNVNKLIDVFWKVEAIITDDKIEIKSVTTCL